MPSRKKAKGKARKAAKEAKAKDEESRVVGAAASQQHVQESVEAQMQRLMINATSTTMCSHGCPPLSPYEEEIFEGFINAFIATFRSVEKVGPALVIAHHTTSDKYADVYDTKLDTVISILLSGGTQCILDGNNETAQRDAMLACYFENYAAVCLRNTQATSNMTKMPDLNGADDHTLVSYYKKRIPCDCLDKKYKEVKSVTKMGHCFNPSCSLPDRKVERSKMFSCSRCGEVNYCSVACQKANWKDHKQICSRIVQSYPAFNSN